LVLLVRPGTGFSVAIGKDKLLHSFAGVDFSAVEVPLRIHGDGIDPMEIARHAAIIPNGAGHRPGLSRAGAVSIRRKEDGL